MYNFESLKTITIILWALFFSFNSENPDTRQLTPSELKEDVSVLRKALEKYHHGLYWYTSLLLTELGILQPESNISRRLARNPDDYITLFESGKYLVRVIKKANSPEHRIPILRFSKVGEELLNLVVTDPHEGYLRDFFNSLQNEHMEIDYSFIFSKKNENYEHTLPWMKFSK
jgi:hypothetical protein